MGKKWADNKQQQNIKRCESCAFFVGHAVCNKCTKCWTNAARSERMRKTYKWVHFSEVFVCWAAVVGIIDHTDLYFDYSHCSSLSCLPFDLITTMCPQMFTKLHGHTLVLSQPQAYVLEEFRFGAPPNLVIESCCNGTQLYHDTASLKLILNHIKT